MGYKYQFITLAGIHSMGSTCSTCAQEYAKQGMTAYVEKVQEPEFAAATAATRRLSTSGKSARAISTT